MDTARSDRAFRPGRRAVLASGAAVALAGILPLASRAAAEGWTWEFFTDANNDIWQRSSWNGTKEFDFRLGGGGAVAQMRFVPGSNRALLSPTFQGEETDRVMQSVLWGLNVNGTSSAPDTRWNVDQAGDYGGTFQRTVAVQNSGTVTDVWTIADRQWFSQLTTDFAGADPVPQLTRYTRLPSGALEIRRVLRLPKIVKSGATVSGVQFYLENWLPFNRSTTTFDSMVTRLNSDGTVAEWYQAGSNIPNYPWTPTSTTSGYAIVAKHGSEATMPNVAVVFSKSGGIVNGTAATVENVRNSLDWNDGIGILPGMRVTNSQADSILDYTVRIVPNGALNAGVAAGLADQVNQIAAPALYGPGYGLSGELATIASRLRGYVTSGAGTRTNHLAPLLS